jgi:hypothetical protein
MITKVEVISQQDFEKWYQGEKKSAQTEKKKLAGKAPAAKAAEKQTVKAEAPDTGVQTHPGKRLCRVSHDRRNAEDRTHVQGCL